MRNDRVEFIVQLTKKLFSEPNIISVCWTTYPENEVLRIVVFIKMKESVFKYEAQYDMSLVKSSVSVIVEQAFRRLSDVLQENSQCN